MTFNVKINGGMLRKGSQASQLNTHELTKMLNIKEFKELLKDPSDSRVLKHNEFIKIDNLTMQDDMQVFAAIRNNKKIPLTNIKKRGFYYTLSFTI